LKPIIFTHLEAGQLGSLKEGDALLKSLVDYTFKNLNLFTSTTPSIQVLIPIFKRGAFKIWIQIWIFPFSKSPIWIPQNLT
jgi:hypothetical protein